MSLNAPAQKATLVRFGHKPGDIVKLEVRSGESVATFPPEGDPQVQETEQIVLVAQATAHLDQQMMIVDNTVHSLAFRRNEEVWELEPPKGEQQVKMLRSGAEIDVDPNAPLAPFVFPTTPVAVGDGWDAAATLNLNDGQQVPVVLRCTVIESETPERVVVNMESDDLKFGDISAKIMGRMEVCTRFGCLIMGALGNLQTGREGGRPVEWRRWMILQQVSRLGMDQFAHE